MIITVIGARPQFVKAAVVSHALRKIGIEEKIIHTGQHYDDKMSQVFWNELGIPEYDVNLNVGSGTHAQQTAQMMVKIEAYLLERQELVRAVLLYGDTNSTLSGALAAAKLNIPIIHVEAGLRSFNRTMPEEVNRVVTDQLSHILFCPSRASVEQLAKEGIVERVYSVGDVMYDALLKFKDISPTSGEDRLQRKGGYILMTIHRPSNTDNEANLQSILSALRQHPVQFVWPIHPRTRKVLAQQDIKLPPNVRMTEPFSYFEMLEALKGCDKVVTDSGGLQKEAYWLKKPCVTLRDESEWIETVHSGWNILTGPDTDKITHALQIKPSIDTWVELYGDGKAADRIAGTIKELLYRESGK